MAFAYDWPFDNVNGPHTISGTLGEFRTNHLHAGVDVNPTSGLASAEVKAIDECTSAEKGGTGDLEYLDCGRFRYQHIRVAKDIDQKAVTVGKVIGYLKSLENYAIHLHLEEGLYRTLVLE